MPPVRLIGLNEIPILRAGNSIYETMAEFGDVFQIVNEHPARLKGHCMEVELSAKSKALSKAAHPEQLLASAIRNEFRRRKLKFDAYARAGKVYVIESMGGPETIGQRGLAKYRTETPQEREPAPVTRKAPAPKRKVLVFTPRTCQRGNHTFTPTGPRQLNCEAQDCDKRGSKRTPKPHREPRPPLPRAPATSPSPGLTPGQEHRCPFCRALIEHPLAKTCGSDTCKEKKRAADYRAKHPNAGKKGRGRLIRQAPAEGDAHAGIPPLHTDLPTDSEHHRGISLMDLRGKTPPVALLLYAQAHDGLVDVSRALPILQGAGIVKGEDGAARASLVSILDSLDHLFTRTRHTATTYEVVKGGA